MSSMSVLLCLETSINEKPPGLTGGNFLCSLQALGVKECLIGQIGLIDIGFGDDFHGGVHR